MRTVDDDDKSHQRKSFDIVVGYDDGGGGGVDEDDDEEREMITSQLHPSVVRNCGLTCQFTSTKIICCWWL